METTGVTSTTLAISTRTPNIRLASVVCSRSSDDLSSRLIAARSTVSHLQTVSQNYPGEMFEISEREVLVVSANVPPQVGETDEHRIQCENANVARATHRQQEVDAAAAAVG
jgi:hypothetical protein